jgi:hypothetical protein
MILSERYLKAKIQQKSVDLVFQDGYRSKDNNLVIERKLQIVIP